MSTAVRRERARRAVLAEAVAEMRRKGKPECEMADLFMDFKGIQVTLAVMAQAMIDGRIDCKTAGQMVVHLQMMSKLLRMIHRKGREGRKGHQISPQISADERRLGKGIDHRGHRGAQKENALTTKDTRSTPLSQAKGRSGQAPENEGLPRIDVDQRRLSNRICHRGHIGAQREKALTTKEDLSTKDTRSTSLSPAQGRSGQATANQGLVEMHVVVGKSSRIANRARTAEIVVMRRADKAAHHAERAHSPPESKAA
jgi:hypothetical protein